MGLFGWLFGCSKPASTKDTIAVPDSSTEWKDAGNPSLSGDEYWLDVIKKDIADGVYPDGVKKVWRSCEDGGVCPLCSYLDGMALEVDEPFEVGDYSVQFPPLYDGCRCTLSFEEPRDLRGYTILGQKLSVLKRFLSELKNGDDAVSVFNYYGCTIELCEEILSLDTVPSKKKEQAALVRLGKTLDDLRRNKEKILKKSIDRHFLSVEKYALELKTKHGRLTRMEKFFYAPLVECEGYPPDLLSYAKKLFDGFAERRPENCSSGQEGVIESREKK